MKYKEHLSVGTLHLLLTNELPEGQKNAAGLHLSYCPICREQRDELALQLAAQRMWEAYEQSGAPGEPHIDNSSFQLFWLGQLRDEQLISQISRHCVACLDCRRRRESVREELAGARAWALTALISAAYRGAVKRHRLLGGLAGGLLIALGGVWFLSSPTADRQAPANINGNSIAAVSTNPQSNVPAPPATPIQNPPLTTPPKVATMPRRRAEPARKSWQGLLALAQTIDLTRAFDGAFSRTPEGVDAGAGNDFKIVAAKSGSTRLRISLPQNSKRGVYYVSIRDSARLDEIVPAIGRSPDGVSLYVSLNIQNLKEDEYVLRIERASPQTGNREYIGDFEVVLTMTASQSVHPVLETPAAEK